MRSVRPFLSGQVNTGLPEFRVYLSRLTRNTVSFGTNRRLDGLTLRLPKAVQLSQEKPVHQPGGQLEEFA